MHCAACGIDLPFDASFCPKCGQKVGAAPASNPAGGPELPLGMPGLAGDDEPEQELWKGGYSGKAMVGPWIAGVIASIGLIVASVLFPPAILVLLALLALLWLWLVATLAYRKLNIRYQLTSQRLIHQTGILSRRTDRIEMIDIDDVTYRQGLVERFMDVGTIRISSTDRTHPELVLLGIDEVQRIADLIDNARRKERRKRGLHIEQI
jgi:membrane protein YdbS with pleckstrin-like domain